MDKKEVRTIGDITRSTEEEFKAFKRMLNNLMITPEKLNAFIQKLIDDKNSQK